MPSRSRPQGRPVIPLSDPERTNALWLLRCSESPDEPLRIVLDYTLLDRLACRPGDRIALEPVDLDRRTREGALLIRRANADEPAIKLRRGHYERKQNPRPRLFPDGPDGPDFEWPFPAEWVETFFPLEYIPGPGAPVFMEPDRSWLLSDLPDRGGPLAIRLDCSLLEFRLQRTAPVAHTLDVHLPPGVLHLMGWSSSTPLTLTSASGFDPSTPDDVLTIRRANPGEPALSWDGAKFIGAPNPSWLDRYFPGLHDNTEGTPPQDPHAVPADSAPDCGDADVVKLPGQSTPDEEISFEDQERDTFCVHFRDFQLGHDSLSFAIPETSESWE